MADLTDFAKRKCHLNMCKPSKVVANKVCICRINILLMSFTSWYKTVNCISLCKPQLSGTVIDPTLVMTNSGPNELHQVKFVSFQSLTENLVALHKKFQQRA